MELIKVRNGLLEQDNYYMTSNFTDFLGVGTTHRTTDSLYINTADRIERKLPYNDFLIQIRKENWEEALDGDYFVFYIADSIDEYGIKDTWGDSQNQYQRILYLDGFAQFYVSNDNVEWTLINSTNLKDRNIITQGFRKNGVNPVRLMDFILYKSPILTFQNFPYNSSIELYDSNDKLLFTRLADINNQVEFALINSLDGYIKVYDPTVSLIYTSKIMKFNFGDTYLFSDFALEVSYNGTELASDETTLISSSHPEKITISNVSDTISYTNLAISAEIESNDLVEFSLDGENFTDKLIIPSLSSLQNIEVYISITKGINSQSFASRDFLLKIE